MKTAKTKTLLNSALVCLLALSAQSGVLTSPGHAAAPAKASATSATQLDAKIRSDHEGCPGTFYKSLKGFTQTMSTEMKNLDSRQANRNVFGIQGIFRSPK